MELRLREAGKAARAARRREDQLNEELVRARTERARKERSLEEAREEVRSLAKRVEKAELDKAKAESIRSCSGGGGAGPSTSSNEGFFQDVLSNFKELVETNLQCSVCSELFVFATTVVGCGHSFCEECLEEWRAMKEEGRPNCPICRANFRSTVPCLALDDYVEKAVEGFFPEDAKEAR